MEFLGWGLEKVLLQFAVLGATGPSHVGWGGGREGCVYTQQQYLHHPHSANTTDDLCSPPFKESQSKDDFY